MNEKLIKAYDIIKEEQRNADNKANLFIIIISASLAFFSEIPSSIYNQVELAALQYIFLFLVVPLMLFVWSLIPIYSNRYNILKISKKEHLNILYWRSIYKFDNVKEFREDFKVKYSVEKLEKIDEDLINQIFVNSNILENKTSTHKLAFYILGQVLLFVVLGTIAQFIIGYNGWIILIMIILELVYAERVFTISSWIPKKKKENEQISVEQSDKNKKI